MTFKAYLDTIRAKTGKSPRDFAELADTKGLTTHGEIVAWLKSDFELGHGHANAMAAALLKWDARRASPDQKLDALFSGRKAVWRDACDRLISVVGGFGPDTVASANETYVNLVRGKKFAILQPASGTRLDIGVKVPGAAPDGRFEAAGSWNAMVTHRVRIADAGG